VNEYGGVPPVIWTGIEAGEPAGELGSVALLVKTSAVWAWAELRAAARAKRKRKIRRMVVGEMNLVESLTERRRMVAGKFLEMRNFNSKRASSSFFVGLYNDSGEQSVMHACDEWFSSF
jgi:hypothetical protein